MLIMKALISNFRSSRHSQYNNQMIVLVNKVYDKEMYTHYNQTMERVFIENSMSKITSVSDDELYVVAKEQWSCFKLFTKRMCNFFLYLDRFYTKRQGLPKIKGGGTEERIFKEKVSSRLAEETINEIMST